MHSCQLKCICASLNACSDQVFATLSMLYLQIAPWAPPVAMHTAQITVCTLHYTVCRLYVCCICRLHLPLLANCNVLTISVQCSLLLTAQITLCITHCTLCTTHAALQFDAQCALHNAHCRVKLFSTECQMKPTRNVF